MVSDHAYNYMIKEILELIIEGILTAEPGKTIVESQITVIDRKDELTTAAIKFRGEDYIITIKPINKN